MRVVEVVGHRIREAKRVEFQGISSCLPRVPQQNALCSFQLYGVSHNGTFLRCPLVFHSLVRYMSSW